MEREEKKHRHGSPVAYSLVRAAFGLGAFLTSAACGSGGSDTTSGGQSAGACASSDEDGVNGGYYTFLVEVSDTGFAVGGVGSGSTESNIAVQNFAIMTLTVTNTGTKPHDLVVQCIPTSLPAACMARPSCFDNLDDAGSTTPNAVTLIPPLQPGASQTRVVQVPLVEGVYNFISDVPGDDTTFDSDGGVSGNLSGDFVLM